MKVARVRTNHGVVIAEARPGARPGDGVVYRTLDEGDRFATAENVMDPTLTGGVIAPGSRLEADDVELLAPCARPTYLAEMENNHRDLLPQHHGHSGYPMLTLLPGTVVNGPGGVVTPPAWSTRVVVTAELAFVCARTIAGPEDATPDALLGYTLMIAIADFTLVDRLAAATSRDVSMNEDYGRWFDGYRPLGPWLVTTDELPSAREVEVTLQIGDRRLVASGAELRYEPLDILARLASHLPFSAGDIVGLGGMGRGVEICRPPHPARVEVTASCDRVGDLVCTLEFPGGPSSTGHPGEMPRAAAPEGVGPNAHETNPHGTASNKRRVLTHGT